MDKTVNLRRYYNERHHGKGPTDDVGGSIRNRIYRYAMSYKCVIKSPNEFSNYANKVVNGITSLYLPEDDLLTKVDHIEEVLKIPETLSIHMLVRNFNEDSICSIQFFNLAVDIEPFFTVLQNGWWPRSFWLWIITTELLLKPVLFGKAITRVKWVMVPRTLCSWIILCWIYEFTV